MHSVLSTLPPPSDLVRISREVGLGAELPQSISTNPYFIFTQKVVQLHYRLRIGALTKIIKKLKIKRREREEERRKRRRERGLSDNEDEEEAERKRREEELEERVMKAEWEEWAVFGGSADSQKKLNPTRLHDVDTPSRRKGSMSEISSHGGGGMSFMDEFGRIGTETAEPSCFGCLPPLTFSPGSLSGSINSTKGQQQSGMDFIKSGQMTRSPSIFSETSDSSVGIGKYGSSAVVPDWDEIWSSKAGKEGKGSSSDKKTTKAIDTSSSRSVKHFPFSSTNTLNDHERRLEREYQTRELEEDDSSSGFSFTRSDGDSEISSVPKNRLDIFLSKNRNTAEEDKRWRMVRKLEESSRQKQKEREEREKLIKQEEERRKKEEERRKKEEKEREMKIQEEKEQEERRKKELRKKEEDEKKKKEEDEKKKKEEEIERERKKKEEERLRKQWEQESRASKVDRDTQTNSSPLPPTPHYTATASAANTSSTLHQESSSGFRVPSLASPFDP
ncbi:hypothetical protein ADUPG1_011211, partial [Aduncisulcus paluster]